MVTPLQRLTQLDLASLSPRGGFFPSPSAWEDQLFYLAIAPLGQLVQAILPN